MIPNVGTYIKLGKEIPWCDEFSLGIGELDKQHEKLLKLINTLLLSMSQINRNRDLLKDMLQDIADYAQKHFSYEEKFIKVINFPGFKAHHKEHLAFFEKVKELEYNFKNSFIELREILEFLFEWFWKHTQKADKQFISHYKEHRK